jgi:hypothetical protein
MRKGAEDLQKRFLGGGKDAAEQQNETNDSDKKKKKSSTEDKIRRGLEGFLKR